MSYFNYAKDNFFEIIKRKELVIILVKKRLKEKHVGSVLGYFWTLYTALFPLFSYVLVFFFIAGIKVKGAESPWEYVVYVFSGLLPWLFFNQVVVEGVDSLNSNLDLLRQAIFPVELISVISVTETLFNFLAQSLILIMVILFINPVIMYKIFLLPFFILLHYMFCLGLAWILSILGFFLRDLKDIISSSMSFLIYLTPVVYSKENVPESIWILFEINPLTHSINFFRDIVYNETIQSPESIIIFATISICVFITGYLSILNVKKTIGDMV